MENEFNEILDDEGLGKTIEVEEVNDVYYKWGAILAIVSVFLSALPLLIGEPFGILAYVVGGVGAILALMSKENIRSKFLVIICLVLLLGCSIVARNLF